MRARDRAIGIVLGILLGLALVILFVFLGSGSTIDSPDISGTDVGEQTSTTTTTTAPEPPHVPP